MDHKFSKYSTQSNARRAARASGLKDNEFTTQYVDEDNAWKVAVLPEQKEERPTTTKNLGGPAELLSSHNADKPEAVEEQPLRASRGEWQAALDRVWAEKSAKALAKTEEVAEVPAQVDEAAAEIESKKERKPREKKAQEKAAPDEALVREAANVFHVNKPNSKHIERLRAAHRGQMPAAPTVWQPSYERAKAKYFDRIAEAIATGDRATVMSITDAIVPSWTIHKVIRTYGLLASIAMAAKA